MSDFNAQSELYTKVWNLQPPNSTLRQKYSTAEEYVAEMKRLRTDPNWAQKNATARMKGRMGELEAIDRVHTGKASRHLVGPGSRPQLGPGPLVPLVGGKKSRKARRARNKTSKRRVSKR